MGVDRAYGITYTLLTMTTVSATTARANLYDLIDEVAASGKSIGITKKGETKAVLVNPEELRAWEVTVETLSDPELMAAIKEGDKDMKAGRYIALEDVEKELGLVDNRKNVSSKSTKTGKKRPR